MANVENSELISEEEKELYDRQIRLWGLEAQNRLRSSKVLLVGLSGCGAEIAKDLVLAGIKSLTLLDNQEVTEDDQWSQLLVHTDSVGQNRAEASKERCQLLNPNVQLLVDKEEIGKKDEAFFCQYDLVILVDQKYSKVEKINDICRKFHIRFQAAGVFGWVGYEFSDFNNHSFLMKRKQNLSPCIVDNISDEAGTSSAKKKYRCEGETEFPVSITIVGDEDEKVKMNIPFASWSSALNVDWSHKKLIRKAKRYLPSIYFPIRALLKAYDNFSKVDMDLIIKLWKEEIIRCGRSPCGEAFVEEVPFLLGPQLSPTCAIVGAVVAQEAIKALSQNEAPLQNLFLYSSYSTSGVVCSLPPSL